MTKLWPVSEGIAPHPQSDPAYEHSFNSMMQSLGQPRVEWRSGADRPPRIGSKSRTDCAGYRFVLCLIDEEEAARIGKRAGWWQVSIAPSELMKRLGPPWQH